MTKDKNQHTKLEINGTVIAFLEVTVMIYFSLSLKFFNILLIL